MNCGYTWPQRWSCNASLTEYSTQPCLPAFPLSELQALWRDWKTNGPWITPDNGGLSSNRCLDAITFNEESKAECSPACALSEVRHWG